MRLTLFTVLLAALAAASAASAKGPSAAHITGPGASIRLQGDEGAPGAFWTIVEGLGFFPAAFGQQPSPMLAARPSGDLRARYAVRWTVPGPSGARQIEQSLYPYAAGGPV